MPLGLLPPALVIGRMSAGGVHEALVCVVEPLLLVSVLGVFAQGIAGTGHVREGLSPYIIVLGVFVVVTVALARLGTVSAIRGIRWAHLLGAHFAPASG